jgi:Domain of unknown function (DUF5122) beta-propeller
VIGYLDLGRVTQILLVLIGSAAQDPAAMFRIPIPRWTALVTVRQVRARLDSARCFVMGVLLLLSSGPSRAQCDNPDWLQGDGLQGIDGKVEDSILWDRDAVAVLPGGDVVAGGFFTSAGGVPASRIARWNGSAWSPLGSGMNNDVLTLIVLTNGDLVAGGDFTMAGGVSASNIARWDSSAWLPLGCGMSGEVRTMALFPSGDLAVAGQFAVPGLCDQLGSHS